VSLETTSEACLRTWWSSSEIVMTEDLSMREDLSKEKERQLLGGKKIGGKRRTEIHSRYVVIVGCS
jgi:hypothetical protein